MLSCPLGIAKGQEPQAHEYAKITAERVSKALAAGAGKKDITLAEGSLAALGWFVLYGNNNESQALAKKLNELTFKAYNGTEKIHPYMEQQHYSEMLNLNRFEKRKPVSSSPEYTNLTRQRVQQALAPGTGPADFKLAEGSLGALGWLTLYGNDAKSLEQGTKLMNIAAKTWPGSDELYMVFSSEGYAEIINLGRFKSTSAAPASGPAANPKVTGAAVPEGYAVLPSSKSSDGRYGVIAPDDDHYKDGMHQNKLIEIATGNVLAVIEAETATAKMRNGAPESVWSQDGSLLFWYVPGRWSALAMVLIKVEGGKVAWQTDIAGNSERAIVAAAKKASPAAYSAATKFFNQSGQSDGTPGMVMVDTAGDRHNAPSLPFPVKISYETNYKAFDTFPKDAELNAEMSGTVNADGTFSAGQIRVEGASAPASARTGGEGNKIETHMARAWNRPPAGFRNNHF